MAISPEIKYTIDKIMESNNLGPVLSCKQINIGFNRMVYEINGEYILKICLNSNKYDGVFSEIDFYVKDHSVYHPELIDYDKMQNKASYVYTLETKIKGCNLFEIWGKLSLSEKENVLSQLTNILKSIHSQNHKAIDPVLKTKEQFNRYYEKLLQMKIFDEKQVAHVDEIQKTISRYFVGAQTGFIHGDVHFNNLIYTDEGVKLIDYECYHLDALDKEFDTINRFAKNPELFDKSELIKINPDDYAMIMDFFKMSYASICNQDNFENRLLMYECINALRWMRIYPDWQPYHDVLFDKSRKLLK